MRAKRRSSRSFRGTVRVSMNLRSNARLTAACIALVTACKEPTPARVDPEPTRRPVASLPDAAVASSARVQIAPSTPDVVAPQDVPNTVDVSTANATDDSNDEQADAGVAPQPVRRVARNEPYTLEVDNQDTCDLRLGRDGITARCTNGSITCTQLLTGAITAAGATDTLWDCERSTQATHYVVLSTASRVVWGESITARDDIEGACAMDHASAELVNAGSQPTQAILVHARDCQFSGTSTSVDNDYLWFWRDDAMHKLAEAQFSCEFSSTRMGRNFGAGMVSCRGEYVVPNAAGTGVNVIGHRVAVRQAGVGSDRLMKGNGHIQRRLTWARMLSTDVAE